VQKEIGILIKQFTSKRILQVRRDLIIYRLRSQGYTVSSLAEKIGVTPQAVTNTLRVSYPRIEKIISKILREPVQKIFPERYHPDGRSLRRRGRPPKKKDSTGEKALQTISSADFCTSKSEGGERDGIDEDHHETG